MFHISQILWISAFAISIVILQWTKISQAIPDSDYSGPRTTPRPPIYDYIPSIKRQHNAVLIFLHRAGLNGTEMKHWVQVLIGSTEFQHVKVIFPTAPVQSYTLLNKKKRVIWYDQDSFTFDAEEKLNSFKAGEKVISEIINYEINTGISMNRIIIGGFSMGGVMALHYGYRLSSGLAGVFALSAFLPNKTKLYDAIRESNQVRKPHLFMATGDGDEFIREKWCEHTFEKLQECDVKGEYYSVRKMLHTMSVQEMVRLWDWIHRIVPDGSEYDVQTTPEDSGTDEDYYGDRKYTKFQKIVV